MDASLSAVMNWLEANPQWSLIISLSLLVVVAWLANWLVKRILVRGLYRALSTSPIGPRSFLSESPLIARLANIVPALVIYAGIHLIPDIPETLVTIIQNVTNAFIVLTIALAINSAMTLVNQIYEQRPDSHLKPIKGYVQVVKIIVFVIAGILMVATLIDRSPLILLSGLGAMAAVLMLIFQDTLLSLVASVQITSNDLIRVGDWIEMPDLNADGDVIDIALHTVKVQNWDKTITVVPTKRFLTDPFKNWRGMQEVGGRRIKRAIVLDQQTVHFLNDDERQQLDRFNLLKRYLADKQQDITEWNAQLEDIGKDPVNTRRVTNIGCFRAYVLMYLQNHPHIRSDLTLMSRQLNPTPEGIPIEVYCFTDTVIWPEYENIQSDIFDHLLAILPEFGLQVFQHPSGRDMRSLGMLRADTESASSSASVTR